MDAPNGVFRHWALYDIMANRVLLPEGVGHGVTVRMKHGLRRKRLRHPRYDGPCPSESDGTHLYRFRLVALSVETPINLPKEPAADLWDVVQPYILAQADLIGLGEPASDCIQRPVEFDSFRFKPSGSIVPHQTFA